MDKLMTIKEVAEHLNVTYQAVLKWINEGRLEANKIGRVWRISQEQLDEFINSKKAE